MRTLLFYSLLGILWTTLGTLSILSSALAFASFLAGAAWPALGFSLIAGSSLLAIFIFWLIFSGDPTDAEAFPEYL